MGNVERMRGETREMCMQSCGSRVSWLRSTTATTRDRLPPRRRLIPPLCPCLVSIALFGALWLTCCHSPLTLATRPVSRNKGTRSSPLGSLHDRALTTVLRREALAAKYCI